MLALILVSVVINYLDRTNISVAASAISKSLDLSSVQIGLIFSVFAWTYVAMQIPGGMIVDRIKTRILYSLMLFFWSFAGSLNPLKYQGYIKRTDHIQIGRRSL